MSVTRIFLVLLTLQCLYHINDSRGVPEEYEQKIRNEEKKISEHIFTMLEHYKQEDPVGLPGAPVPDPLDIPPLSHSFSVGNMDFKNVKLFGLSKFRLQSVNVDVTKMEVEAAVTIDTLTVIGNYTLGAFLTKAHGPFTVKLTDAFAKTIATLEVERSGHLEAQDMNMDITFKNIEMDFKGLGFFASMFQGILNSVGTFLFDSIKPFILKEMNKNIRNDVNERVRQIPQKFPNSISPVDKLVSDLRQKIRKANFDPYKVNDYNNSVGIFDIYMRHTWLMGLSSIHRVGDVKFEMKNNTIYSMLEVGTQKMVGTTQWEIALIAGMMSRAGTAAFSVEYLNVQTKLSQTMDTRNPPHLDDIQLELGNIQLQFEGAGTADYIIEFGINVIPNLLRYQIMDAIEGPIKQRVQEVLNTVNVERMIKQNVDKIDNPGALQFLN